MVLSIFDLDDYTSLLDIQPLKRINVDTGYNYYLNGQRLGIGTQNPRYELDVNGTIRMVAMEMVSDERRKFDIKLVDTNRCMDIIRSTNVYTYVLNGTSNQKVGFIAQDIEKHLPECVTDDAHTKTIDLAQIVAVMFSMLKSVDQRVSKIEESIQGIQ